MSNLANYRKYNDRSLNRSTYHKKDGTNVRAKLKEETKKEIEEGAMAVDEARFQKLMKQTKSWTEEQKIRGLLGTIMELEEEARKKQARIDELEAAPKVDLVHGWLKDESWFNQLGMDQQGLVCIEVAKRLDLKNCGFRWAVLNAADECRVDLGL